MQDSIKNCQSSLIEKILSDKPLPAQVLYNTLAGIWCKPTGLKISELEGKILQIKMDKEEDAHRILKDIPWILRNCWFILHLWDRNQDIHSLNFSSVSLWIQFWDCLCIANPLVWDMKWDLSWEQS